ncbi:MAG: hypothetical protein ACOZF0_16435 [Thermodesulfobacteriota bacterium]
MTLQEILDRCGKLKIHEIRSENEEYYEIVIYNAEMEEWHRLFTGLLGPARKPEGVEPTDADLDLTRSSGGIRANQTLFESVFSNGTIIAKFWPWEDNIHTTLKMALLA